MHQSQKRYLFMAFIIAILAFVVLAVSIDSAGKTRSLMAQRGQTDYWKRMYSEQSQDIEMLIGQIAELQQQNDYLMQEPEFIPWDIPLDPDLQIHTYEQCQEYGIETETVIALMYQESGWNEDVPDGVNRNGTRDRGLAQINEIHWSEMESIGLDVNSPYDNITYCIMLLAYLQAKYPELDALASYNAGETGMSYGRGYGYAKRVISIRDAAGRMPGVQGL